MDLYNLPPLDMQLEPLRLNLDNPPGNRLLLGVALFAVCGLLVSLFASAPSPASELARRGVPAVELASNAQAPHLPQPLMKGLSR